MLLLYHKFYFEVVFGLGPHSAMLRGSFWLCARALFQGVPGTVGSERGLDLAALSLPLVCDFHQHFSDELHRLYEFKKLPRLIWIVPTITWDYYCYYYFFKEQWIFFILSGLWGMLEYFWSSEILFFIKVYTQENIKYIHFHVIKHTADIHTCIHNWSTHSSWRVV